jgi:Domain of unknown function (DUF4251)
MKTRIFLIMITLILGNIGFISGQDGRASKADIQEQRAYEKQKQREARDKEREENIEMTSQMVKLHRFVLEADYLSNKYGARIPVSREINFIMVDSSDAVLQTGSAFNVGFNGVGGETVSGRITKFEYGMTGKKKDSYSIQMVVLSPVGVYDINLLINPEGYADASIRGNWSGQLNYHGRLVPLGLSRVYTGQTRY